MKTMNLMGLALIALLLSATSLFAQTSPNSVAFSGSGLGAGLGAAFCIVGAGIGFGKIGAAALESMARQPEVAGKVQTAMIVIAALLEGATFFALLVCIQLVGKAGF
jgi:F-type H+-transporting ATPase subunit c